jgi:hypothetical protein
VHIIYFTQTSMMSTLLLHKHAQSLISTQKNKQVAKIVSSNTDLITEEAEDGSTQATIDKAFRGVRIVQEAHLQRHLTSDTEVNTLDKLVRRPLPKVHMTSVMACTVSAIY